LPPFPLKWAGFLILVAEFLNDTRFASILGNYFLAYRQYFLLRLRRGSGIKSLKMLKGLFAKVKW
jgi:hypothetical protein